MWTDQRFGKAVLDSLDQALSGIKQRYGNQEFELIGYSGGGTDPGRQPQPAVLGTDPATDATGGLTGAAGLSPAPARPAAAPPSRAAGPQRAGLAVRALPRGTGQCPLHAAGCAAR
uniref:VWFA domain-containing protein n=1 Tax=Steinernema glaseri TaxID=37863 RepID=A0A1I8AEA9_9BILA